MNKLTDWIRPNGEMGGPRAQSAFVVGLGRFGTALAGRLVALGVEVLAIDTSQELVNAWADQLTDVRLGDGTNPAVLRQLGAADYDAAIVAIGSSLEASILTTSGLADLEAPNIWAKAVTNEHGRILERVGAHHVVYPERQAGERVARVVSGKALDYFPLDDGYALVELVAPREYLGTSLGDSDIRSEHGITVVCAKPRGGSFSYVTAETELAAGDLIVLAGTMEDIERFTNSLRP